ncbi:hypothetical protein CA12_06020 [Alienimonas californiensis]|uniref:DUF1559 domain-containing protein n=2 Tax=Alienimonas californiensis TaxID=2527989 RepID=A0A517P572_9PLAN|nr:hypothetical protein CA12_06020 [Alienimonas californiensis]
MLRRAGVAAALGVLVVAGLTVLRPTASAQPPTPGEKGLNALQAADVLGEAPPAAVVPGPPLTLGGAPADARGPADLLPADGAVAFVAWAGTAKAGPAFAQTAAHKSLIDSGLLPTVRRSFGAVWQKGFEEARKAVEQATGGGAEQEIDFHFEVDEEDMKEGDIEFEVEDLQSPKDNVEDGPQEFQLQPIEENLDAFDEDVVVEDEEFDAPNPRPEALAALQALGDATLSGGVTLSVHLLEGPPLPSVFVVLPGAADAAEALLSQTTVEEREALQLRQEEVNGVSVTVGNVPGVPPFFNFGLWRVGPHLVGAIGPGAVQRGVAVTTGDAAALGTHPLAEHTPDDALLAGWLDFATVVDRFGEFPAYEADWRPGGQVTVGELLTALGLDALSGVRGSLSADGEALRSEGEWLLRGEPRGLLAALDPAPMSLADLPPLPAEVKSFGACSVDFATLYDGLIDAAGALAELQRPDSRERAMLENAPAVLNDLAGFDVRAALLEPLGSVAAVYSDPHDGGLFGLGGVVAIAVEDAATLKAGLATVADRALTNLPPDAGEQVRITAYQQSGVDVTTVSIAGMFRPSLAVTDEWIVFAPTPQAVAAFLLRADGTLPTWGPTGRWEAPFGRVPAEFTSLSASDPRPAAAFLNNLIGTLLPPINHFAGGPADAILPPSELVTGPLFPNVKWATNTGEGVQGVGYASLPTPMAMGGGGSVATPAILASLLLPAVQQAREAARRMESMNNLKQLGLAAHNYHTVFDTLPRGTAEGTNLPPERRLSWVVALLPYLEEGALAERLDPTQAWDAGPNAQVARTALPWMVNPSDPNGATTDEGYAVTHYVGVAGVGPNAAAAKRHTAKTGIFGYDRTTKFADVTDGLSNTLMYGSVQSNVGPWAQGGPSTVRAFTQQPSIGGPDGFGGYHAGGTDFLTADGAAYFISENIDPQVLEALATARGGEDVDWDEVE